MGPPLVLIHTEGHPGQPSPQRESEKFRGKGSKRLTSLDPRNEKNQLPQPLAATWGRQMSTLPFPVILDCSKRLTQGFLRLPTHGGLLVAFALFDPRFIQRCGRAPAGCLHRGPVCWTQHSGEVRAPCAPRLLFAELRRTQWDGA